MTNNTDLNTIKATCRFLRWTGFEISVFDWAEHHWRIHYLIAEELSGRD